eukprot:6032637-Prymnesium_polylepis.2
MPAAQPGSSPESEALTRTHTRRVGSCCAAAGRHGQRRELCEARGQARARQLRVGHRVLRQVPGQGPQGAPRCRRQPAVAHPGSNPRLHGVACVAASYTLSLWFDPPIAGLRASRTTMRS